MKKLLLILAASLFFSAASYADGHGRGHHKHHRHHPHDYDDRESYPEPRYYGSARYQDPRPHQGLAGGVVGSVLGYELGKGDPIATGLGAAAGSYLGNNIAGRR